jgi:hypothetical protein
MIAWNSSRLPAFEDNTSLNLYSATLRDSSTSATTITTAPKPEQTFQVPQTISKPKSGSRAQGQDGHTGCPKQQPCIQPKDLSGDPINP